MVNKRKNKSLIPLVLQKYRNNLKYFKQLKDLLDAHETHKKSKVLQDELNQKQRELNFRLERDRISGELENNRLPLTVRNQLEERKEKLIKAIKYHIDDLDKIK